MAQNILLNSQDAKHYKSEFIFKLIDIMKVSFLLVFRIILNSSIGPSTDTLFNCLKLPKFKTQSFPHTSDIPISNRFSDK